VCYKIVTFFFTLASEWNSTKSIIAVLLNKSANDLLDTKTKRYKQRLLAFFFCTQKIYLAYYYFQHTEISKGCVSNGYMDHRYGVRKHSLCFIIYVWNTCPVFGTINTRFGLYLCLWPVSFLQCKNTNVNFIGQLKFKGSKHIITIISGVSKRIQFTM